MRDDNAGALVLAGVAVRPLVAPVMFAAAMVASAAALAACAAALAACAAAMAAFAVVMAASAVALTDTAAIAVVQLPMPGEAWCCRAPAPLNQFHARPPLAEYPASLVQDTARRPA